MPNGHIKVSGVWKALNGLHVKVSGTWKGVQSGYIKVSGTWKEFYSAVDTTITVTIATLTGIGQGFIAGGGGGGSVSPSTIDGHTITQMVDVDGTGVWRVLLSTGSLGAGFFDRLEVEDPSGTFITLNGSDASYTDGGTYSQWDWSSTYWTGDWNDDIGADRDVKVYLA